MSKAEQIFVSKAPVRIDFSGGYTDIQPFCNEFIGKSLNLSINSYTTVIGRLRSDKTVRIFSLDLNTIYEVSTINEIRLDGELDLVKRIILDYNIDFGIDIIITCDVQFGTGLGTSASLSVALTKLFCKIQNISKSKIEIAEYAAEVERKIGITGGKQDQYASILGGINFYEFFHHRVKIKRIILSKEKLIDLEKRLLLIHTGGHRNSSNLVDQIMANYATGDLTTILDLNSLNSMIDSFVHDIQNSDFQQLSQKINYIFHTQKNLNENIIDQSIKNLINELHQIGFCGIKLTGGAGPGAYILVLCEETVKGKIVKILNERQISYLCPQINKGGAYVNAVKKIPENIEILLQKYFINEPVT